MVGRRKIHQDGCVGGHAVEAVRRRRGGGGAEAVRRRWAGGSRVPLSTPHVPRLGGAAERTAKRRGAAAELVVVEEQAAQPRRRARAERRAERARARVADSVVGDRELLEPGQAELLREPLQPEVAQLVLREVELEQLLPAAAAWLGLGLGLGLG